MKLRHAAPSLALLTCAAFSPGSAASADTNACERAPGGLAVIVQRNTAALGGKANIEAIQTLEIDLLIVEPDFTVTGTYRATRDGRMRIDIYADGERVFTEAYDGTGGWQMGGEGSTPEVMRTETAAILRRGTYDKFYGWYDFEQLGLSLDYLGREMVNGECLDAVKLDYNDGEVVYHYLDTETGRIRLSRDYSALHPDIDPEKRRKETVYSEFREVDGRLRSFREVTTDIETGEVVQTTTLKAVKQNLTIDAEVFARPGPD